MAQFQKGRSGNPGGRPPSSLNKLLSEHLHAKDGSKTREQQLVEQVCALALQGDMDAIKFVWERLEGKVRDSIELETGPLSIRDLLVGD